MASTKRGVNTITAGEAVFLLTVGGGAATHLTRESAQSTTGQEAVPNFYFRASRPGSGRLKRDYDRALLTAPHWAEKTLCGRPWIRMASGEGGPIGEFGEDEAFAPTCRRCLASLDRLFPEPQRDDRFPLVAQLTTDLVIEHGYAEIRHVPGDQQSALRKHVRLAVRRRTGHTIQTFVHESMVIFVCEPIHKQHETENMREVAEVMNSFLTGEPIQIQERAWRLSWDTWNMG
jgi:hypothetical protein